VRNELDLAAEIEGSLQVGSLVLRFETDQKKPVKRAEPGRAEQSRGEERRGEERRGEERRGEERRSKPNGTNLVFCRVFDPDFDAGSFGATGKDGSADFLGISHALANAGEGCVKPGFVFSVGATHKQTDRQSVSDVAFMEKRTRRKRSGRQTRCRF